MCFLPAARYYFNTAAASRTGGFVLRSQSVDIPSLHVLDNKGFELHVIVRDPSEVGDDEYVLFCRKPWLHV